MLIKKYFQTLIAVMAVAICGAASAQNAQPEYRIGNGDSIRILVFQNPDLTTETRVTENGTISYPLVGTVRIGGLTIPDAGQAIAKALSDGGFIQKPQVNIVLLQNRGNQVSVLGAVGRPGRYPLETVDIRLSEMIAIAGGVAPTGGDFIIITGLRNGTQMRRQIDIVNMLLNSKLDDDIVVAGGDLIYVHKAPQFYIYGEVQRAGAARIERDMTIRQALAQSGGPTARGTERRMRLFRRSADGKVETLSPGLNDLVQPDDVIYINESLF